MSLENVQNYLYWLDERGLHWPIIAPEVRPEGGNRPTVAVIIQNANAPEHALLSRMLSAIHLDESHIADDVQDATEFRLVFGPPPAGQSLGIPFASPSGRGVEFHTYHPGDLISVPELKSLAWRQLKAFAALISERASKK